MRRPAARAVTVANMDIVVTEIGQRRSGLLGQRAMTLDGVDVGGNFGKDRGRIARTGADFEHLFAAAQRQCLDHERDDIGLRDRLAFFNRQGGVIVGKLAQLRRQEGFARHATHGIEHQLGPDAARKDSLFHHLLTKFQKLAVRKLVHGLRPYRSGYLLGSWTNGICVPSSFITPSANALIYVNEIEGMPAPNTPSPCFARPRNDESTKSSADRRRCRA